MLPPRIQHLRFPNARKARGYVMQEFYSEAELWQCGSECLHPIDCNFLHQWCLDFGRCSLHRLHSSFPQAYTVRSVWLWKCVFKLKKMKSIKMCGVQVHYPYEPYPQQINIAQVAIRSCLRLQNGAVEVPTGCGKTMGLLCSSLGFVVDQRYKVLEAMDADDSMWQKVSHPINVNQSLNNPEKSTKNGADESSSNAAAKEAALDETVNAVASGSCSVQNTTPQESEERPKCSSGRQTHLSSLVVAEDDDFLPLPRLKSERKRARFDDHCGNSCASSCGSYTEKTSDTTGTSATIAATQPKCEQPLIDIEDIAPTPIQHLEKSTNDCLSKNNLKGDDDGGGCEDVVIVESECPLLQPLMIDLTEESTEKTQSSPAQVEFEYPTQEFLSQSFYETDPEGDGLPGPVDMNVSRDAVREALRKRTRVPAPRGEFGPTRRLVRATSARVPKIFYSSRTHLQLDQVANEIKRTAYHDARVVVLSSREQTCINDSDFRYGKWFTRTEMCHELLGKEMLSTDNLDESMQNTTKSSCVFFRNSKSYETFEHLESREVGPVVDINVLVRAGRRHKFCPYFVARNLISTADIILCPVNYLIDPIIRKRMNMCLKGQIVIIDEAHMLEDMCRDIASLIQPLKEIQECYKDCCTLIERQNLIGPHQAMADLLQTLQSWIKINSSKAFSRGFGRDKEYSLSSCQLIASFEQSYITKELVARFAEGYFEAARHREEVLSSPDISPYAASLQIMNVKTDSVCERLAMILNMLFEHPEDYVGAVTFTDKFEFDGPSQSEGEGDWFFKLVCQNPALIFNNLSSLTRSIIFSSATLHPMDAFAAELGVELPNRAIKGHVIPPNQTWIGCLPYGKGGKQFYGVFNTAKTDEYMDEIGQVVLDVCQRVPYGILVFVTSYRSLEKTVQRWKDIGLWANICEHKRPLQESRRGKDFNDVLKVFYFTVEKAQETLQSGEVSVGSGCTGPLLIAVMRGKVSEGFNFSDDKTRAIVTVGIPYPNINEDMVKWKREYNNINVNRNIQNADGWYNTQAFRALSQSLGRGLRHRHDWCILLLLEARLQNPKYFQCLPEWMYQRMQCHNVYDGMLKSIEEFVCKMNVGSTLP